MEITPKSNWWELNFKELWEYRDLIFLFVRRDFITFYKQTILGPLWYILQPLFMTFTFFIIFNKIGGISTDGLPPILFYMSGLVIWNYFSQCFITVSNTFVKNANIYGKVYFPRLVIPISNVISNFISFGIQFILLIIVLLAYWNQLIVTVDLKMLLWMPFILLNMAALGLGLGLIITALTIKYRDLSFMVSFGVQLLMYFTPVIYSVSTISDKYKHIILFSPLAVFIEMFRYIILGVGFFDVFWIIYATVVSTIILFIGIVFFNKAEKTFVDVI